ncbi:MAG: hypothetical protein AB1578_07040 [Thermodesulfobacteriota bacterium]
MNVGMLTGGTFGAFQGQSVQALALGLGLWAGGAPLPQPRWRSVRVRLEVAAPRGEIERTLPWRSR